MMVQREFAAPFLPLVLSDQQLESILAQVTATRDPKLRPQVDRELFKKEIAALGWSTPLRMGEFYRFDEKRDVQQAADLEHLELISEMRTSLAEYLRLRRLLNEADDPPPPPPPATNEWLQQLERWLHENQPSLGRRAALWQQSFDDRVIGLFAAAYDIAGDPTSSAVDGDLQRSGSTVRFITAVLQQFNLKAKSAEQIVGPFLLADTLNLSAFAAPVPSPSALKDRILRARKRPVELHDWHPLPSADNYYRKWRSEYGKRLQKDV